MILSQSLVTRCQHGPLQMVNYQPLTITSTVTAVVLILEAAQGLLSYPIYHKITSRQVVAVVVWSHYLYNQEAHHQLWDNCFYLHLHADPRQDDQKVIKDIIRDMVTMCDIPPTTQHLVSIPHTSSFYMLPKIHNLNNPGCPVVSACCCPTENITVYLNEVIALLIRWLPTYSMDTNDTLRIFDIFTFDSSNENPISCSHWT